MFKPISVEEGFNILKKSNPKDELMNKDYFMSEDSWDVLIGYVNRIIERVLLKGEYKAELSFGRIISGFEDYLKVPLSDFDYDDKRVVAFFEIILKEYDDSGWKTFIHTGTFSYIQVKLPLTIKQRFNFWRKGEVE